MLCTALSTNHLVLCWRKHMFAKKILMSSSCRLTSRHFCFKFAELSEIPTHSKNVDCSTSFTDWLCNKFYLGIKTILESPRIRIKEFVTCHKARTNSLLISSPACVEIIRSMKTPSLRKNWLVNFRSDTSSATGFVGWSLRTRKYFRMKDIPCNKKKKKRINIVELKRQA